MSSPNTPVNNRKKFVFNPELCKNSPSSLTQTTVNSQMDGEQSEVSRMSQAIQIMPRIQDYYTQVINHRKSTTDLIERIQRHNLQSRAMQSKRKWIEMDAQKIGYNLEVDNIQIIGFELNNDDNQSNQNNLLDSPLSKMSKALSEEKDNNQDEQQNEADTTTPTTTTTTKATD